MSLVFTIMKDGKEITREEAFKLMPFSEYSLDGKRSADSDHYMLSVLTYLQKYQIIDFYHYTGELDPLNIEVEEPVMNGDYIVY